MKYLTVLLISVIVPHFCHNLAVIERACQVVAFCLVLLEICHAHLGEAVAKVPVSRKDDKLAFGLVSPGFLQEDVWVVLLPTSVFPLSLLHIPLYVDGYYFQ